MRLERGAGPRRGRRDRPPREARTEARDREERTIISKLGQPGRGSTPRRRRGGARAEPLGPRSSADRDDHVSVDAGSSCACAASRRLPRGGRAARERVLHVPVLMACAAARITAEASKIGSPISDGTIVRDVCEIHRLPVPDRRIARTMSESRPAASSSRPTRAAHATLATRLPMASTTTSPPAECTSCSSVRSRTGRQARRRAGDGRERDVDVDQPLPSTTTTGQVQSSRCTRPAEQGRSCP